MELPEQLERENHPLDVVVTIGGGVVEQVLDLEASLRVGHKHTVLKSESAGGSGVNYTVRLLNKGIASIPILSIGNDDGGNKIRHRLMEELIQRNFRYIRRYFDNDLYCEGINTAETLIVTSRRERIGENREKRDKDRTAFTTDILGVEKFPEYAKRRLCKIGDDKRIRVRAVMIGHIYADSPDFGSRYPTIGDITVTEYVIDAIRRTYADTVLIYANLGRSQIVRKAEYWKSTLSKVDIFQLSLDECRDFFGEREKAEVPLIKVVDWCHHHGITGVITLGGLGALVIPGKLRGQVVFARPVESPEIVDPTGAGDAFGVGLVYSLINGKSKSNIEIENIVSAVSTGRDWAAEACRAPGGAGICRADAQIRLQHDIDPSPSRSIQILTQETAESILWLIDRAY